MRILQYSLGLPPYRRGGLPTYSTDLSIELSKNNDVYLLYPGKMPLKPKTKLGFAFKKSKYPFEVIEMKNPLPVSLGLGIDQSAPYMNARKKDDILTFLKKLSPDVIHIHTLMGLPIEFLEATHQLNIKTIYTTHDFYGLCPKMLQSNPRELLATRTCSFDCMLCKQGPSLKKIQIMQSHAYMYFKNTRLIKQLRQKQKGKIADSSIDIQSEKVSSEEINRRYKLRLYYMQMFELIDEFHFNSSVSRDYLKKYFPNAKGKVINITHKGIERNKLTKKFNKNIVNLGYIGPYDKKKGFFELIGVLREIRKENINFEFHAYGDILQNNIFNETWAHNHGIVESNRMKKVYQNIDILVVPSLWHETFGFSVLEALSQNDVCLVSQNVGAKDLVDKNCIFKNKKDMEEKIISFLQEPIKQINNEKSKIKIQNLPTNFVCHVNDLYEKMYVN